MVPLILPTERGGWWHDYVCASHGVELDHVGLLTGVFPDGGAPCRHGCRIDTPEVRGAWTVLAHQACARRIRELAHSTAADDRALAAELIAEYAKLYAAATGAHDGAAGWMLRGRLFHQALTEAICAVRIGAAARELGERDLPDALASAALAARTELVASGRFTSNYTAWLNAAGAVCSGDPVWLHGEHWVYAHVLAAVGEDGWEWEGSSYYQGFVLRAYLIAVRDKDVPAPVAPAGDGRRVGGGDHAGRGGVRRAECGEWTWSSRVRCRHAEGAALEGVSRRPGRTPVGHSIDVGDGLAEGEARSRGLRRGCGRSAACRRRR